MRKESGILLQVLCMAVCNMLCGCGASSSDSDHILWYDSPAQWWEETLPLGNGRLGMMAEGGVDKEMVILNEISLWSGCERDYANPDAAASLPQIRQLLLEGRNAEAQDVMYERFVPRKAVDEQSYGSYQVLGGLMLDYHLADPAAGCKEHISASEDRPDREYRRWLDLRDATAYTEFTMGGTTYTRRYHVDRKADVMVVEVSADRNGMVGLKASLYRPWNAVTEILEDGLVKMSGEMDSGVEGVQGVRYSAYMRLIADGKDAVIRADSVCRADKAWIIVSAATSFFEGDGYDAKARELLDKAVSCSQEKMYRKSVKAHKELYDRVELRLASNSGTEELPTDKRLEEYAKGAKDNSLAVLYYNYGRYLLVSSTRPGSLPPNLQGLWANTRYTPWNGDYHTNINVQMNHWIAEPAALSELHLPLTDLVMRMIPSGEKTAKDFYGPYAKGWVQHMMTNVWNYTAPGEHPSWGATNTGGAWLCAHLWEHYLYTEDTEYLERVYPALEGASRFFISTMIREPGCGYLVTAPSSSPENAFYCPEGITSGSEKAPRRAVSICMGPTMDTQLVRELFSNTISAHEILNTSALSFIDSLKAALTQLPPHRISPDGYLQEWLEDYEEADPQHRHVSHLYGLHPGSQISPSRTPELAQACRKTLERRGDEATGWSRAWKMNFWARLGDGDRALKLFRSLLHPAYVYPEQSYDSSKAGDRTQPQHVSGTYPNLFCAHPPFQIDGNFGGAAGISEMLLQSHEGFINPLPALPSEWSEGSLRGFKVRGGASVSLSWKDGKLTRMKVRD